MVSAADIDGIRAAMTQHVEEYKRAMLHIREEMSGVQARIRLMEDKVPQERGRGRVKETLHLIPEKWTCEKDGTFNDLAHDLLTYMTMAQAQVARVIQSFLRWLA